MRSKRPDNIDPFDEERGSEFRARAAVIAAEGNKTFVETAVTPSIPAIDRNEVVLTAMQQELTVFTRISDLSEDLEKVDLEETLQNTDLIIWRYDKWHSAENDADFLTLEVSLLSIPEKRYITNFGGQVGMKKIENAFEKVALGQATAPLVASFRKIQTNNGRSFWVVE